MLGAHSARARSVTNHHHRRSALAIAFFPSPCAMGLVCWERGAITRGAAVGSLECRGPRT